MRRASQKTSRKNATALFAYAAGATAILANAFLVAFYALLPTNLQLDEILGSASDLVGSLATAFMIPVALYLGERLPHRRHSARLTQAAGLTAMALLSVGGPHLVLGVVPFEVETSVSVAAWMVLCVWLLLINRWLGVEAVLPRRLARLGEVVGAGPLAGGVVVGLGLLLPWMPWVQLVFFGVGGLPGSIGWLGISVWFVLLGRHLR